MSFQSILAWKATTILLKGQTTWTSYFTTSLSWECLSCSYMMQSLTLRGTHSSKHTTQTVLSSIGALCLIGKCPRVVAQETSRQQYAKTATPLCLSYFLEGMRLRGCLFGSLPSSCIVLWKPIWVRFRLYIWSIMHLRRRGQFLRYKWWCGHQIKCQCCLGKSIHILRPLEELLILCRLFSTELKQK